MQLRSRGPQTKIIEDTITKKRKVPTKEVNTIEITETQQQNELINYNSYFFRKDIVSNYQNDLLNKINKLKNENPNLKTPMDFYKIYNLDSVLEYCGTKTTYNLRSNPQNEEERKNQIENLKNFLASNICSGIGEDYAMKAVKKAFEKKEFDIAVLATSQMEENIDIIEDDDISESQLTEYSQTTQYEDYSYLLGKDIKDSQQDKEYLPENYRKITAKLRNNNLFKYRTSSIKAFIIVELGECKLYPRAFSVNLICAKKGDTVNPFDLNSGAVSGSGNILMGLYLYSILCHPDIKTSDIGIFKYSFPKGKALLTQVPKKIKIEDSSKFTVKEETEIDIDEVIFKEPLIYVQHIAVLELAGAYTNAGGLCSYEKFGYNYNPQLYGANCFEDYNNLPMVIYFNTDYSGNDDMKKMRVVSIAAGDKKADFNKSLICNIRDNMKQKVLGFLKNANIYLTNNVDQNEFKDYNDVSPQLEQILMYIYKNNLMNNLITYIENPQQKQNPQLEKIIKNIYDNMADFLKGGKKTGKSKNYKKTKKNKSKNRKTKSKSKSKTKKSKK